MNTKLITSVVIILIVLGGIVWYGTRAGSGPGRLDSFAQCIKDSGAKFYGAYWCPHCQNQKKLFGNSAKLLPYIECSTPDGNNQTLECREKGIQSYPTWIFADGSIGGGEQSLEKLALATKCSLPGTTTATSTVSTTTSL